MNGRPAPAESTVIVPLEGPYDYWRKQVRGCSNLVLVLAVLSLVFGALAVLVEGGEAALEYLISASGPLWLMWLVLFFGARFHERRGLRNTANHIKVTSSAITVPHGVDLVPPERVGWADLREVRMTRNTSGRFFYEFYTGEESPAIVLDASRVLDRAQLEREIEKHAGTIVRTFEFPKPAPLPPSPGYREPPLGERFEVRPSSALSDTAAGCLGLFATLVLIGAVAFAFPGPFLRWMDSGLGIFVIVALFIGGFSLGFLIPYRRRSAWLICASDGLHARLPRSRFPSFIAWSDIRDYTLVGKRGMATGQMTSDRSGSPSYELTVWTSQGSYSMEFAGISDEAKLREILRERSARKGGATIEITERDLKNLRRELNRPPIR